MPASSWAPGCLEVNGNSVWLRPDHYDIGEVGRSAQRSGFAGGKSGTSCASATREEVDSTASNTSRRSLRQAVVDCA